MNIRRVAGFVVASLCAALALGACATKPLPEGSGSYAVETGHDYRLGPGDKVRVTVFGEDKLSGEFIVANNGDVAMPLVGDIKAGGLTPVTLQGAIQEKLAASGMVREPKVSADVVSYRPFYILGEVSKPGQYPYAIGLTVTKAVATAGGFTYRANDRQVYITKEGTSQEVPLNLTAASWIGPGDTIRVAERHF
jgi:protein involved in polysaccharide export with SLBB domain